jgi:hypothetical protein
MVTLQEVVRGIEALEEAVIGWKAACETAFAQLKLEGKITEGSILTYWRDGNVTREVPMLGETILDAAEALYKLCNTQDIDREAWEMVKALDVVIERLREFELQEDTAPGRLSPDGGRPVWDALNVLLAARRKPREKRLPTPITQLLAEGVNRYQIAKEYGWYLEDGSPDVRRLDEEIQHPGTQYSPETWVSRRDQRYWDEMAAWFATRRLMGEKVKRRMEVKVKREWSPPSESMEDLIFNGVNAAQIAKMWRTTVEEVYARAAELGVALDSAVLAPGNFMQAQRQRLAREQENLQRTMDSQKAESYRDLGDDRDGRILRMAEDGHKPRAIADALKREFPGLTPSLVGNVLARARKETASS